MATCYYDENLSIELSDEQIASIQQIKHDKWLNGAPIKAPKMLRISEFMHMKLKTYAKDHNMKIQDIVHAMIHAL